MARYKTAALLIVVLAGVSTAVFQHSTAERLRAENRDLRERVDQLAQLQQENERLSNLVTHSDRSAFSKEQASELLRLRGEVGQLRASLKAATAANQSAGANQNLTPVKSETTDDSTEPFTADLSARIGDGQTLITGGWSSAPGMRSYILMTPKILSPEGEPSQVAVGAHTVTMPEGMLAQYGIDQLKADGRASSVQKTLTSEESQKLLKMLAEPPDGLTVTRAMITTKAGMQSEISVQRDATDAAEPGAVMYSIGLTPNLTSDQKGIDMSIKARLARTKGPVTGR
jgi:hypothetical protein